MPHRRTVIDAIRGLCLVNIFVNHIDGGVLWRLSPSRLAVFDCADVFVLLSGASTALAYGSQRPGTLVPRLWRRAGQFHAFNVGIVLTTIALLAAIRAGRGQVAVVDAAEIALIDVHGLGTVLWHILTLRQDVGYSAVLRLYVALMLIAPFLMILARWRWWSPLVPTALLWIAAGHFRLVARNSLSGEPQMLTILPWAFVFAIGIVLGRAITLGIRLPRSRPLLVFAVANLAGYLILSVILVRLWPPAVDWAMGRHEAFWSGASKTYQSPLRLLHLLALTYLVLALPRAPVIRLVHEARPHHLVCRLGKHSLPVFGLGAVGAVAASEILDLAAIALHRPALPRLVLELALIGLYVRVALGLTARWPMIARPFRRAGAAPDPQARDSRPAVPGGPPAQSVTIPPVTATMAPLM